MRSASSWLRSLAASCFSRLARSPDARAWATSASSGTLCSAAQFTPSRDTPPIRFNRPARIRSFSTSRPTGPRTRPSSSAIQKSGTLCVGPHGLPDRLLNLDGVKRLHHVRRCAGRERLRYQRVGGQAGDHHHARPGGDGADLLERFDPTHLWHEQIEQHHVRPIRAYPLQRLETVPRLGAFASGGREHVAEDRPDKLVVVNDEDPQRRDHGRKLRISNCTIPDWGRGCEPARLLAYSVSSAPVSPHSRSRLNSVDRAIPSSRAARSRLCWCRRSAFSTIWRSNFSSI